MQHVSAQRALAPDSPSHAATRRHLRGSSLLLAGRLVSLALNFASQVVTVRYLAKADYGALSYALALVSLGSSVTVFGFYKSVTRFVPIYLEQRDFARMFGTIVMMLGTVLGLGSALVAVVFGLQGVVAGRFIDDPLALSLLMILVTLAPVEALDRLFNGLVAVFASPRAIFFRRHLLGPGLKLAVVLGVACWGGSVHVLAGGYLAAGVLGVLVYLGVLAGELRRQGLLEQFQPRSLKMPVGEVLRYSAGLASSDVVLLLRGSLVVFLLAHLCGASQVAEFRAVVPVAGLTKLVMETFQTLYMPAAARLFARDDRRGINDLYWRTAAWSCVLTFPLFAVCFALAGPLTVLLFGERYEGSAVVLAILAAGYFFDAALGFNALTLKVFGKVRTIVALDLAAAAAALAFCLLLIPRYGALGGALATCATLVVHNLLNQAALLRIEGMDLLPPRFARLAGTIALGALALLAAQWALAPPLFLGLPLAALVSAAIAWVHREELDIGGTFPELARFPLLRRLLRAPGDLA